MSRIVIGGGTGLLGTALTSEALSRGYDVVHLVRPQSEPSHPRVENVRWNPAKGELDADALRGATAVVAFNGVGILDRPWTSDYKRKLYRSRVHPIRTIVTALRSMNDADRPGVFVSGSAIGYYGPDSLDATLTEESNKGNGFLADLVSNWEAEALKAAGLTRVVLARTGLVMSGKGGMLGLLKYPYRVGLGARLGNGKAWMSTISLEDHARAILHCIEHEELSGPVNITGPDPVRNRQWHRLLARHYGVPSPLFVPAPAIKLALGEAGREATLSSARVVPEKLLDSGFEFRNPTVRETFRASL